MLRHNTRRPAESQDVPVGLTSPADAVWSRDAVQVTHSEPCAIDARGVTLYRWARRSIFIPLEQVDRFDVVPVDNPFDSGDVWMPGAGHVERLVLFTRDGMAIRVSRTARQLLWGSRGLPLASCARQLNGQLLKWRGGHHGE